MKMFTKFFNNIKSKFTSNNNNIIIHNKFILYLIFFISLADLFYLSVEQDIFSIVIFILIGFLTTYFSKNMLIILFIALTLTNVLKYGSAITNEGFEEDMEVEDETETASETSSKKKKPTTTEPLDNKKDEPAKKEEVVKGKSEEIVISKKKLESGNLDDIHKEEEALKMKDDRLDEAKKKEERSDEAIKMFSKIVNALNS